ncbi:hypothetical protein MBLNU457_1909t2 [Dothideomycetes sp. NU457]
MATPSRLPSLRKIPTSQPRSQVGQSEPPAQNTSRSLQDVRSASPTKFGLPKASLKPGEPTKDARGTSTTSRSMLPPPTPISREPAHETATQRPRPASNLKRPDSSSQPQRQVTGQDTSVTDLKRSTSTRSAATTTGMPSGLQRTTSIRRELPHARTKDSIQTAPASGLGRPVASHARAQSAAKLDTKDAEQLTAPSKLRPTFTTHQQHYSPAKTSAPKPPIPASRIAPPAPSSTNLDTFETQKLQSELLYLSLLHQYSTPTLTQYTASAKRTLRKRFETIRQANLAIIDEERWVQRTANIAALAAWSLPSAHAKPGTSEDLTENVQRLSRCLSDVTAWTEPDGRYEKLVTEFESWVDAAETILGGREMSTSSGDLFISPLPSSWHQSHASMEQRVRILEREVTVLPPAPERESSEGGVVPTLIVMLDQLKATVEGMNEELGIMISIEKEMLSMEKEWVDKTVERILRGGDQESERTVNMDEDVPLWHRLGKEVVI